MVRRKKAPKKAETHVEKEMVVAQKIMDNLKRVHMRVKKY